MNDIQPICMKEEKLKRPNCFNVQSTGRRCLYGFVVVILAVAIALAIYLPLTLKGKDSPHVVPDSGGACPTGYTGQFCNEPVCERLCYQGVCVRPGTCMCNEGWSGQQCDTAICETPCTEHGNCTSPDTCTCDVGWQGLTCEMPFSPGFQPKISYFYDITLSYAMETEIEMNTNEMNASKEIDRLSFLSSVNITFSVSSVSRKSNTFLALLKILNVTCNVNVKNQTENLTCDKDSTNSLLQINLLFSQDITTGKILEIFYNASTEFEAVFVARILRFIDCEVLPWMEKDEKISNVNKQRLMTQKNPSKSPTGMKCFDFKRTVTSENITTNREEKRVCLGKSGVPENISMSEMFSIGQDVKLDDSLAFNSNLSLLPTVRGRITALGSLISMKPMTNSDVSEGRIQTQDMLGAEYMRSSLIDELAIKNIFPHEEYDETNVLKDIDAILKHPYPNRRLSLGLDLVKKSKSAISVIKKMVFSRYKLDKESRALLIAILGASNTHSGQKGLLEILDAKEMVENDHFIALGSVAQLSNISDEMVSVVSKIIKNTMNEDLKTRSILVLGVMGSKGLQHKIVPILAEMLSKKDVSHTEKCALISALGNTHSENAFEPLSKLFMGNETHYKILSIRALKNIPGQESYKFVLERLLNTRNKNEAIQCIKTLGYKKMLINGNDLNQILHIALKSKDRDFLNVVKNMFLELKKSCENHRSMDYNPNVNALEIDYLIREMQDTTAWYYGLNKESQNFGVYFRMMFDFENRKPETYFNANANLDVKVFDRYATIISAGSANTLEYPYSFWSTTFMTLHLFGRDHDLFTRSWRFPYDARMEQGDTCQSNNGIIWDTPVELFSFNGFNIINGLAGFSFISFVFGLSGPVSFGYGFNAITDDYNSQLPHQLNIAIKPQQKITLSVSIQLSIVVAKAGVRGDLDAVSGSIQTNVAYNLRHMRFCQFISANVGLLSGSLNLYLTIGYWPFKKEFEYQIFEWNGITYSRPLSETYCCPRAFLTNEEDAVIPSETMSPELNYTKTISNTIFLLIATNKCFHSINSTHCPTELIHHLQQKGVYVFNISMSKKLNAFNNLFFQRKIFPVLITGFGQWYGLNKIGDLVELNEIGQITKLQGSVGDLLANMAYEQDHIDLRTERNNQECVPYKNPYLFNIQERTKILDFRPYCSKMRAVCENIKIGKKYHSDVMVFTENRNLMEINNKQACSSFIRTNGIRYPFYCEAYPFSFSLQGGKGATVIKANVMEKSVKMEAVQKFIQEFGVKGGDAFVVIV